MIRLILVDDHQLFCAGMRALLGEEPGLTVVATAGSGREAREAVAAQECDVIVVDLTLPDAAGASLVRDLRQQAPGCHVLVLSDREYADVVADAFDSGATGYALKSQSPREFVEAIRTVAGGMRYVAPALQHLMSDEDGQLPRVGLLRMLSRREREVFDLLMRGGSNRDISDSLRISIKTVETHRMRLMRKLGVHNVGDLIRLAVRNGHPAA